MVRSLVGLMVRDLMVRSLVAYGFVGARLGWIDGARLGYNVGARLLKFARVF